MLLFMTNLLEWDFRLERESEEVQEFELET